MDIKYTTVHKPISQEAFNKSIVNILKRVDIDYNNISKRSNLTVFAAV